MPLSTLLRQLGMDARPPTEDAAIAAAPCAATVATPPASDEGIAAMTVDTLITTQQDLLSRMKLCYGADRATFERDLLAPIRRLAGYVNVLPATADNFFCEPGGLFRLSLEVAFYALQGTDGHIVSGRATISTRRELEPRWRLATFIGGLCCELHRTLCQLVITDERGDEWPAYLGPLTAWLDQRRSARFFIRWMPRPSESRALGLFALPHVVLPETMQHLATGNSVVVPQLLAAVSGLPINREQNVLMDLVRRAAALVIDRNLIANANRYGRPILGAHIERYLIDAMRRLIVAHPAWLPNHEKTRVWHGREGLFIVWPNAVAEIRKLLEEDDLPGIPHSPQTILEILLGAGVVVPRGNGSVLWTISPPPGTSLLEAIRIAAAEILLPQDVDHKPLPESLVSGPDIAACGKPPQARVGPEHSDLLAPDPLGPAGASCANVVDAVVTEAGEIVGGSPGPQQPATKDCPPPPPEPRFRLNAPMRLQPQVRDALALAVESMNGDPRRALAITVPAGVFIPLEHFRRANVDLPVVMRALGELRMTVCGRSGTPQTVHHDFGGRGLPGLVLRPQFVEGLDPGLFACPGD